MPKAGYQRIVIEVPVGHHLGLKELALKESALRGRTTMQDVVRLMIAQRLAQEKLPSARVVAAVRRKG